MKQGNDLVTADNKAAVDVSNGGTQGIEQRKVRLPDAPSKIGRYGLAVLSIFVASGIGFFLSRNGFTGMPDALFFLAISLTAWYAGNGPAILALLLSGIANDYFFIEPLYTFDISRDDLPHFVLFTLIALLVGWFSSVRRKIESDLRHSRDKLDSEVKERRALNTELERRSEQLQASNRELEAFAYSVSHDLRAPIRHIAGYTDLLQNHANSVLDDTSRQHVAMILESTKRMGNLVDDLLAFSRIGQVERRHAMVELQQLVEEVARETKQEIENRDVTWHVGALPTCYGDYSMLRLVFVNLLSNAVKFTRGRPRAEIEIGSLDSRPDELVVFVKDNGVGFNMKYENKLFGVFQRLHSQRAYEGTGIGLATVQRIIARHGGRVWAEGYVNSGATFYVALPKTGSTKL